MARKSKIDSTAIMNATPSTENDLFPQVESSHPEEEIPTLTPAEYFEQVKSKINTETPENIQA